MQTTADASAVGAGAWLRVAVSEVGIRRWVGRPSLQKHIRLLQFFEDTLSLKLLPFDVRRKENACVAKQRRHAVRELFHRSSVWRREVGMVSYRGGGPSSVWKSQSNQPTRISPIAFFSHSCWRRFGFILYIISIGVFILFLSIIGPIKKGLHARRRIVLVRHCMLLNASVL